MSLTAEPPTTSEAAELESLRQQLEHARAREALLRQQIAQLQGELQATRPTQGRLPRLIARLRRYAARRGRRGTPVTAPVIAARALEDAKQALRAQMAASLDGFLRSRDRLDFSAGEAPDISIILVLFNQAPLTFACLRALATQTELPVELVIVDNASTDQTDTLLGRIDGARIIRNSQNRHFLHAVNQAAERCTGRALLLLNNDAVIRRGTLEAAWQALWKAPDVGAVGGMIILPDGRLQEAGSIIFSDGTCLGYGRGRHPAEAEFQFARDVDFCSGAFLLLRRSLFEELGGLDTVFAPAYYEETDLCMRLRAHGYRILYDPRVVIDHYEFGSSASSAAALALQARNHATFLARHQATLAAEHAAPGTPPLVARMHGARRRLLYIDDRIPYPSMGAGYPRSAEMLHALVAEGWFVTLYPLLFPDAEWEEVYRAFPRGMEVMLGAGEAGLAAFLRSRAGYYDRIIVCRPHNMRLFLHHGGAELDTRIVYDAEAVFATRDIMRLKLEGRKLPPARQQAMVREEIALGQAADSVITVSPGESALFLEAGCTDVTVLGHTVALAPTVPGHAERQDLLFVGALDDDPSPNTDALLWFAAEIMPLLDGLIGSRYRVVVAGRCGAARVQALAGERIMLLGRVDDLTPWYAKSRLFVAPTRYSGGIPHKIHEAAARGLPVVATHLLGGQLGWQDGAQVLLADTATAFAAACARLYQDAQVWQAIRDGALARLAVDCDPSAFRTTLAEIVAAQTRKPRKTAPMPQRAPARKLAGRATRLLHRARFVVPFLRANGFSGTLHRLHGEWRLRLGRRDYATWIKLYDTLRAGDPPAIAAHIASFAAKPTFSLIIAIPDSPSSHALAATLRTLVGQLYPHWEACLAGAGAQAFLEQAAPSDSRIKLLPNGPEAASGEFVISLQPGDLLRPHTLYMFAAEYDLDPDLAIIYCDEDRIDGVRQTRTDPLFKSDYESELLRGPDALGSLCAIRRHLVAETTDANGAYDLVVRVAERCAPGTIAHIPRILVHRPARPAAPVQRIVAEHLQRLEVAAEVAEEAGRIHVRYSLPNPPLVSVIIPTRDRGPLLRRCVQGLLAETDYPNLEILIVDNDSIEPRTHKILERLATDDRVRVLPFSGAFNYAAMNNQAAAEARGEVLALLNNDIAIRQPGWLREMVAHAIRPDVGAVGAKLYYADGSVQHAGVITGIHSIAGHIFRHAPHDSPGYAGRLQRVQSLSCVTAACMVLRREVYLEADGLDEVHLPVSYNDVDFCLRLRAKGYRIIWTPFAELDHLESVTRGRDDSAENIDRARREAAYMARRWGAALGHDPAYNPNLTLWAEDFSLAFPPRVGWPWRET